MANLVYGKIPPQAVELEEALLGAMLLEREKQQLVLDIIPAAEMFYMDAHQKIYQAIRETLDRGLPVDLLTVMETLRSQGELEIIGGAYYLTRLTMNVVSSAHSEGHARIILEKYLARQQIRIGAGMVQRGYDDQMDVFDSQDMAEEELYELASHGIKKDVEPISTAVAEVADYMEKEAADGYVVTGIASGFKDLDRVTKGWHGSRVVIIAARPAVGKTAFALNLLKAAATIGQKGKPVASAMFSLEMSKRELMFRMIAECSGVDLERVQVQTLRQDDDQAKIQEALHQIARMKIHIDDTAGLTVPEFRSKARRLKAKHDVQLIVIDYLQLMVGDKASKWSREQEVSGISRDLKKVAKELDICIIPLCQLSRDIEKTVGRDGSMREPQLSDLRESGSIEQDADLVGFLYRPSKQEVKHKPHLGGTGMFYLKKNRHGITDDFLLKADMRVQRWHDMPEAEFKSYADASQKAEVAHVPGATMAQDSSAGTSWNTGTPPADGGADDLPF